MGHSQFAELIGAAGPEHPGQRGVRQHDAGVAMAEDWIRAGRCERVVVVAADDVTSDHLLGWMGAGFLASGAAATDEVVEEAAVPFDRRRHGMILGMGAAAIVVESRRRGPPSAASGRSARCSARSPPTARSTAPGSTSTTSATSWSRSSPRPRRGARGARRWRRPRCSSPTRPTRRPAAGAPPPRSTPCAGCSATAADQVVVANTKGFTGHPMGVGIEDVVAVKALETGIVPPVPNFKEPDPDLGELNLSIGGVYPVRYALRLAAGFGSQISMLMLRWVPTPDGATTEPRLARLRRADRRRLDVAGVARRRQRRDRSAPRGRPPDAACRCSRHGGIEARAGTGHDAGRRAGDVPAGPDRGEGGRFRPTPPRPGRSARCRPDDQELAARVVALVAEQTGYPPELLDLDLDLEADLGIDTVKQAELFAQVRETYGIARDDTLKLRDYPTLNHVIGFVRDRPPTHHGRRATAPVAPAVPPALPADEDLAARVVALVAEQTGYPPELLDLDLDLEADLGIDTVKQAELFAQVRETYGIARDDSLKLRDYPTLNHVIGFVRDRTPHPTVVAATAPVAAAGRAHAAG